MATPAETVPETVAAPEKETEKKEEVVSKSEEKEVQKEEEKEVAEEKNGHSETDEGKKNGHSLENGTEAPEKKATNGTIEENETEEVSDACPVKRKSEAADIPDSKVSEEDAVSCEKKAKIEEKLAAAKGEEVLNSEEAEATA